jgi:hypothetical protein
MLGMMGINIRTGTQDVVKAVQQSKIRPFLPMNPWDRQNDCAGKAVGDVAKDLTGASTVDDIAHALVTGSIQPLVNVGNGLDVARGAGDIASKVLSGTPGKIAASIGKGFGAAATPYSMGKAALGFGACMGW